MPAYRALEAQSAEEILIVAELIQDGLGEFFTPTELPHVTILPWKAVQPKRLSFSSVAEIIDQVPADDTGKISCYDKVEAVVSSVELYGNPRKLQYLATPLSDNRDQLKNDIQFYLDRIVDLKQKNRLQQVPTPFAILKHTPHISLGRINAPELLDTELRNTIDTIMPNRVSLSGLRRIKTKPNSS